jgi:hypothetical protein
MSIEQPQSVILEVVTGIMKCQRGNYLETLHRNNSKCSESGCDKCRLREDTSDASETISPGSEGVISVFVPSASSASESRKREADRWSSTYTIRPSKRAT